jgi:hypothetical protein
MAERPSAPSQSDQASKVVKAEGDRENAREDAREEVRDSGRGGGREGGRDALRTGRGGLDPIELRDVRDETSEKHRRGEDIGASGISNPTLAEEQEEQAEVPPSKTRKAGGGT